MSGKQLKMKSTGVSTGVSKDKPSIDDIRKLTNQSKETMQNLYDEARDEAFDTIVDGADSKIQEAAVKGRSRAYLYTWEYLDDRNDKQFSFKNVRIMDLLTKGDEDTNLIAKLRSHFNPSEDEQGFRVGWMRFQKRSEGEPTQYGVYVSWYVPKEQRPTSN